MAYAENTSVSVERSRAEIETLIGRYGASHFAYMSAPGRAWIEFLADNRRVRFLLPLPAQDDKHFTEKVDGRTRTAKLRTPEQAYALWEQACRQRWRALCLAIKAKLETVASGISTFESEFLAHVVDPFTNKTVGEVILPTLAVSYEQKRPQRLMLGFDVAKQKKEHGNGDAE